MLENKLEPIIKEILLLNQASCYPNLEIINIDIKDSFCVVGYYTDDSHYFREKETISVWEVVLYLTNK